MMIPQMKNPKMMHKTTRRVVNPTETIKAAEDMVSHDTMPFLEESHSVSAPSNMRAQLAQQMLSEQAEQRAFAKKLRINSSKSQYGCVC